MKEVKAKRFAGPFNNIPFENYIQSHIGLVPKSSNRTRLIFHLSYDFKGDNKSVNACTPKDQCSVHYNDLDTAIIWIIFLFTAITKWLCDYLIREFLALCKFINVPVATEKTEWGSTITVFLGILLDGARLFLSIPIDKQEKALRLLNDIADKKKVTVKQLQVLTGYLNFLTKAIHSGRTFTRRMYAKFTGLDEKLKPHHHVTIDREFRFDCEISRLFLTNHRDSALCRPMIDLEVMFNTKQLDFYSDASVAETLGFGSVFGDRWIFTQWEKGYIRQKPLLPLSILNSMP